MGMYYVSLIANSWELGKIQTGRQKKWPVEITSQNIFRLGSLREFAGVALDRKKAREIPVGRA